jgi:hypothetical protein
MLVRFDFSSHRMRKVHAERRYVVLHFAIAERSSSRGFRRSRATDRTRREERARHAVLVRSHRIHRRQSFARRGIPSQSFGGEFG